MISPSHSVRPDLHHTACLGAAAVALEYMHTGLTGMAHMTVSRCFLFWGFDLAPSERHIPI